MASHDPKMTLLEKYELCVICRKVWSKKKDVDTGLVLCKSCAASKQKAARSKRRSMRNKQGVLA